MHYLLFWKIDRSRALSNAVKEGFDYAVKQLNIKEQDNISNELAAEFSALFMEKMLPYIEFLVKSGRQREWAWKGNTYP